MKVEDAMVKEASAYGDWLREKGYKYPMHKKPGKEYVDVKGKFPTYVDDNRPFGLIDYDTLKEEYYEKPEDALPDISPKGNWQILNMITGEIIFEPKWWYREYMK